MILFWIVAPPCLKMHMYFIKWSGSFSTDSQNNIFHHVMRIIENLIEWCRDINSLSRTAFENQYILAWFVPQTETPVAGVEPMGCKGPY